jgi:hypothetical protein
MLVDATPTNGQSNQASTAALHGQQTDSQPVIGVEALILSGSKCLVAAFLLYRTMMNPTTRRTSLE